MKFKALFSKIEAQRAVLLALSLLYRASFSWFLARFGLDFSQLVHFFALFQIKVARTADFAVPKFLGKVRRFSSERKKFRKSFYFRNIKEHLKSSVRIQDSPVLGLLS